MEYQHWLREAISQLQASESPRRDAEILLEHVTGRGRTFILAFGETQLTDEQCQQLDALLTRRRDGEPIAHLTGVREFWSLPLFVSPATLIPRPDTECLVEQALARLPEQPCRILDLGTGTGAIALALASERPDCEITAVDRMPDAVALAQRNAQHLAIKNIRILQSDWFSALADKQQKQAKTALEKCQHLPFILEVHSRTGKHVIAHADYPDDVYEWQKDVDLHQVL